MFHVKHLRDFAYARRKLLEHLCELHVSAGHGSGLCVRGTLTRSAPQFTHYEQQPDVHVTVRNPFRDFGEVDVLPTCKV